MPEDRAQNSTAQNTLNVGKAIAAVPALIASPITGTVRALGGAAMKAATDAATGGLQAIMGGKREDMPLDAAKDQAETAMSAVGPRGTKTVPGAIPSAAEIKAAATNAYDQVKKIGIEVKPQSISNMSTRIQSDLVTDGVNDILAPKTFSILDRLTQVPKNGAFTVNDFRTAQRTLGNVLKSPDATERMAASRALKSLNDHFENLTPADLARGTAQDALDTSTIIKEANANYGVAKRSELLDTKRDTAELQASRATSGQNFDNTMRSRVLDILKSPKLSKGFDAEQIAKMEQIVKGTAPANVIRYVGNLLGGGGGLGMLATGVAGGMAAGPVGIATPIGGFAAKALGNALTSRQVSKLDEMVRAAAPYSKRTPQITRAKANGILAAAIAANNGQVPSGVLAHLFSSQVPARADQK